MIDPGRGCKPGTQAALWQIRDREDPPEQYLPQTQCDPAPPGRALRDPPRPALALNQSHSLPPFLITILMATAGRMEDRGNMSIIIRRPYAYLEGELREAFESQTDVTVVVDRRHGERRTRQESVSDERRRFDRPRSRSSRSTWPASRYAALGCGRPGLRKGERGRSQAAPARRAATTCRLSVLGRRERRSRRCCPGTPPRTRQGRRMHPGLHRRRLRWNQPRIR
jgi:hypothetical protein